MSDMSKRPHIICAVWGPPGGGKTTLSANLATLLADAGYMTCLVSASDFGEIQYFFGATIPKEKSVFSVLNNGRNVREALVEVRPNLCILDQAANGDAYEMNGISDTQVTRMTWDLRDRFSFVIIDCTNYKEAVFTSMGLVHADRVLMCIPHHSPASAWHAAHEEMIDAIRDKITYIDCETMIGGCDKEQIQENCRLERFAHSIPFVSTAFACENRGRLILTRTGKEEKRYKNKIVEIGYDLLGISVKDKKKKKKKKGAAKKDSKKIKQKKKKGNESKD